MNALQDAKSCLESLKLAAISVIIYLFVLLIMKFRKKYQSIFLNNLPARIKSIKEIEFS